MSSNRYNSDSNKSKSADSDVVDLTQSDESRHESESGSGPKVDENDPNRNQHVRPPASIPILKTNNDDGSNSSFYEDSHDSDDSGFDHLKKETKLHRAMNSFMNPNKGKICEFECHYCRCLIDEAVGRDVLKSMAKSDAESNKDCVSGKRKREETVN
jgi:hypothetical protein